MLYSVMEVSKSTGISKQSIYKKLKLKIIQEHIVKQQGVTYITEEGFNLIKDSLKANTESLKDLNNKDIHNTLDEGIEEDTEILSLNKELFNTLLQQLHEKDLQINEKDLQIHELHKIVENSQVLLKEKPQQDILLLEEHFQDLDAKLMDIKEQMIQRKDQEKNTQYEGEGKKSFLNKIFKK